MVRISIYDFRKDTVEPITCPKKYRKTLGSSLMVEGQKLGLKAHKREGTLINMFDI